MFAWELNNLPPPRRKAFARECLPPRTPLDRSSPLPPRGKDIAAREFLLLLAPLECSGATGTLCSGTGKAPREMLPLGLLPDYSGRWGRRTAGGAVREPPPLIPCAKGLNRFSRSEFCGIGRDPLPNCPCEPGLSLGAGNDDGPG